MSLTQNLFIGKINTLENSSTVLSNNSSKRAACHTLLSDEPQSSVNRSNQINLIAHYKCLIKLIICFKIV